MRRIDRWVLGLVVCLQAAACRGDPVGVASETGNSTTGGVPGAVNPVGSGGQAGGGSSNPSGGSPAGVGGSSTSSGGSTSACDGPACIPTVLFAPAGGSSQIASRSNKPGVVLDGNRIYLARQALDATSISGLDYWLRITTVDVVSGGSRELAGPAELATPTWSDVSPLAVDSTYVYWFSRNDPIDMSTWTPGPIYLRRTPKDRSAPEDLARFAAGDGTKPLAMAVDDTYVYWTSLQQGIYRYPKTGGAGSTPELVKSATGVSWPLALAGDYLYWTDVTAQQVLRKGVSATTLAEELVVSNGPTAGTKDVCGLKWTGSELYFAQCDSPYEVHRVSAAGESDVVLGTSGEDPYLTGVTHGSLALDADNVYFLGAQYLYRVPRAGGPVVAIAQAKSSSYEAAYVIGVDDSTVYLLASDNSFSVILKVAKK
jgi:hypothetical protein